MATIELPEFLHTDRLPEPVDLCVVANFNELTDEGFTVLESWDGNGPQPFVQRVEGHPEEWSIGVGRGIDHLYRLERADGTLYVSEPYDLAIHELHKLSMQVGMDWEVQISSLPLWYPGRTVPVVFRRNS